jgi:O-antigen/teichoic acid export membrane protein
MIDYLGVELYGVWSVVLSLMTWILFFDLGIANGVKNKVSESLALNNLQDAKEYISTSYIVISIFCFIIFLIFFQLSYYLDWQKIFNTHSITNDLLGSTLRSILFFILINFTLSIISSIFYAKQESSLVVLNQFLNNFFAFIVLIILIQYTERNIFYLSIGYGISLILGNLFLTFWYFKKNKDISPNIKLFKISKIKEISRLGMKFFFLQLTIFFILTSDRFLITYLLGPNYVASYDIMYKYFGVILIIHGIINSPLWPMYRESYLKNDYLWIGNTLKKMMKLCILYFLFLIILILFANLIIEIWIGKNKLDLYLSNYIFISIMFLFIVWHSIFAYFSNGIEKTNIQLVTTAIGALINIPLSVIFVKYFNLGIDGIILATIISLLIYCILGPIEAFKEINKMKEINNNENN